MPLLNKTRSSSSAADRRWWALVLLAMAEFVVVLDASIVNIALPSIGRGLHISLANLSWVVNAYVLTFGGFLLLGGRIADLLGRRLIFTVGLGVFSLASLLGGLAHSELWLIGARAIQGLGAALLAPAALLLVTAMFREGAERNRALSVWGAVAGSGAAAGVLLGGVLTSALPVHGIYLADLLGPSLLIAIGLGFAFVPITILAETGVQDREYGLASGLLNASQQIGGALGLAVLATIATTRTNHLATTHPINQALTQGFHTAFLAAAGFTLLAIAATTIGTRHVKRSQLPQTAPQT
jgi:MFS family permease